jgi:hypothetical protein
VEEEALDEEESAAVKKMRHAQKMVAKFSK